MSLLLIPKIRREFSLLWNCTAQGIRCLGSCRMLSIHNSWKGLGTSGDAWLVQEIRISPSLGISCPLSKH